MLYKNCRELPIHNFNEVLVYGNYSALIKEGEYPQTELIEAWNGIIDEYYGLSNDKSVSKIFRDKAEIVFLQQRLYTLHVIQSLSCISLSQIQLEQLNELKRKHRVKNLKRSLQTTENELNLKISEFNRMYTGEESKTSFDYTLVQVGRVLGYKINRFTTTVSEWIELVRAAEEISKQKTLNK